VKSLVSNVLSIFSVVCDNVHACSCFHTRRQTVLKFHMVLSLSLYLSWCLYLEWWVVCQSCSACIFHSISVWFMILGRQFHLLQSCLSCLHICLLRVDCTIIFYLHWKINLPLWSLFSILRKFVSLSPTAINCWLITSLFSYYMLCVPVSFSPQILLFLYLSV
jgi:hypothetical protein